MDGMEVPGSMTSDGCDHPVQPAPWMRNAATEIADAINLYGEFRAAFRAACIAEKLT